MSGVESWVIEIKRTDGEKVDVWHRWRPGDALPYADLAVTHNGQVVLQLTEAKSLTVDPAGIRLLQDALNRSLGLSDPGREEAALPEGRAAPQR